MSDIKWVSLINGNINFEVQTQVYPTKGNLVYEYNPFRNYRLSKNMYYYKGDYYSIEDLQDKFGISISENSINGVPNGEENPILFEKGQLIDFITDELQFSIDHPVHLVPQYSYDGSVNLIINDGINIPRLINSRFSATGKNTYEVVNRKGNNDTNIYDQGDQFDIDTSLYKRVIKIPKISYEGTSAGGNMKIGNYHFYFKLADADGNETDFVGESGLVSVFIGFGYPSSIYTGVKDENSYKNILFNLTNLDTAYSFITVYYSRYTAELNDNFSTEYYKINKKFLINSAGSSSIVITGYEETSVIAASDINLNYNIVDSVKTSTVCQNRLFLGNVHKPDILYEELADLSLRFLPYLKQELYNAEITEEYNLTTSNQGYYDSKYIYEKTGYWGEELYRFGIVYIMPNNELSPVFNIRGGVHIGEYSNDIQYYSKIPIYDESGERIKVEYNEETNYIINIEEKGIAQYENVKGVVMFSPTKDTDTIYGIDIRADDDTIQELKKYVKGYFFVRQIRIPTILSQGITVGIDQNANVPCIATANGFLDQLSDSLDYTHVETEDINDVNYISEGFLNRYQFKFEKKSSSIWSKIGKIAAITVGVVALAAASVFTAGAAAAVVAGTATTIAGVATAGTAALGTTVATIAGTIGLGGAVGTTVVVVGGALATPVIAATAVATVQEIRYTIQASHSKKKLDGRNTKTPSGYNKVETSDSRKISEDFLDRIIIKDPSKVKVQAILCPDYEVNQEYYNSIYTGNNHMIQLTNSQCINGLSGLSYNYFTNNQNHFYVPSYYDTNIRNSYNFKIIGVPEGVQLLGMDDLKFRSKAGEAEEAWRYECIGDDYKSENSKDTGVEDDETISNKKINSDIVRGIYGPYLAFNDTGNRFSPAETVTIYIPNYSISNIESYVAIRMQDNSVFNAISDRYDIGEIDNQLVNPLSNIVGDDYNKKDGYKWELYRGDCYICQFTHRLNRNFNSPSSPYNDEIVDINTWKDNYDPENSEKYQNINLGDVNAAKLGMWVTFKVRSSFNLNIRTLDGSNVDESAMCGHPRGFYPYFPMSTEGNYKHQDSYIYNKGFSKSLSERWNFETPDVPHIKNWFGTRIMYSDIHINDAFKNGYRVFQGSNFRDYTREYGEIVKLISLESSLLCIFEHGVALIPVNERAVAGNGQGGNVYINTSNVLPENPKIISDMFGSQWPESVLKVPGKTGSSPQYVYGVDTIAKKIWRTDGNTLTCISDFRVQEFLNNNITLGERELSPKIGIRNVKTVYNSFKGDVLFTFYDNTYGFEEKVWNLCWNETLQKFITFYSWVPSYMENINNIPFSFDRSTSKWIAKLGTSHTESSFADGITLSNVIIENKENEKEEVVNNFIVPVSYINKQGIQVIKNYIISEDSRSKYIGVLQLSNRILPDSQIFYQINYQLQRDQFGNYKNFEITDKIKYKDPDSEIETEGGIILPDDAMFAGKTMSLQCLKFKSGKDEYQEIYYRDNNDYYEITDGLNNTFYTYSTLYSPKSLLSELYYRNKAGNSYADYEENKIKVGDVLNGKILTISDVLDYPIFKDITGKRPTLPRQNMINPDKIVSLLNIKASISIVDDDNNTSLGESYYNLKAGYNSNTSLVDVGYYESVVAITPRWNLQFLSTDFWKHGQAGLIDIADDIYPTYWYGRQHPFEFEFVVVNDPSIHKIFTNLEIIANKAQPESFHYEIIGDSYDFAKDKPNMYFRQEATKALWQYNGADISYNRNFLKTSLRQQPKSADFPHRYYTRQDTINEIEDYYIHVTYPNKYDYNHLSGAEVVYYPNRQEYRIWNHVKAVNIDDFPSDSTDKGNVNKNSNIFGARALIAGNMRYLEDKWKVSINPIIVCYKNEYTRKTQTGPLIDKANSTWMKAYNSNTLLPPINIKNSPIPDQVLEAGGIDFPGNDPEHPEYGQDNALYNLYDLSNYNSKGGWKPLDTSNWLDDINIYKYDFGSAQNRKEVDVRDKFIKIRVRYSGEELAVIDFLNTVYTISYA